MYSGINIAYTKWLEHRNVYSGINIAHTHNGCNIVMCTVVSTLHTHTHRAVWTSVYNDTSIYTYSLVGTLFCAQVGSIVVSKR